MAARIIAFRRSRHVAYGNQVIIEVNGVATREAAQALIGSRVVWHSPGKIRRAIRGIIVAPHGSKGALRARMERGLPGQALGQEIKLKPKAKRAESAESA